MTSLFFFQILFIDIRKGVRKMIYFKGNEVFPGIVYPVVVVVDL